MKDLLLPRGRLDGKKLATFVECTKVASLLPVEEKGFIEPPLTHSLVCIRDAL